MILVYMTLEVLSLEWIGWELLVICVFRSGSHMKKFLRNIYSMV